MDKYQEDAGEWRTAAECTYLGAMTLFHPQTPFVWFRAAILAHHALEQLLKSALIQEGCPAVKGKPEAGFAWGRDLVELAKLLYLKRKDFPEEIIPGLSVLRAFSVFDAFNEGLRYPTAANKVEGLGEDEAELFVDLMQCLRPFAANSKLFP